MNRGCQRWLGERFLALCPRQTATTKQATCIQNQETSWRNYFSVFKTFQKTSLEHLTTFFLCLEDVFSVLKTFSNILKTFCKMSWRRLHVLKTFLKKHLGDKQNVLKTFEKCLEDIQNVLKACFKVSPRHVKCLEDMEKRLGGVQKGSSRHPQNVFKTFSKTSSRHPKNLIKLVKCV